MRVHASALKHGIDEDSVRYAAVNFGYVADLNEDSPSRQLRLGFDQAGLLLERIVLRFDSGHEMAIHAMKARQQYTDLLN